MKKLLIAFCMMVGFAGMVSAQQVAKKAVKPTATQAKPVTAAKAVATPATPAKPATATTAGPVKKDGTLDKRYSANKAAKASPAAGPVKKDGTPDKRFKANKKN